MEATHASIFNKIEDSRQILEKFGLKLVRNSTMLSVTTKDNSLSPSLVGETKNNLLWINCETAEALEALTQGLVAVSEGKIPLILKKLHFRDGK